MTTGRDAPLARLLRAHDAVTAIGFEFSKVCLVVIVFAFSYEVVARYFFSAPVWWANETVSYALGIGAFLAMPEVTRRQGHVAVTVLLDLLPPRLHDLLFRFIQLVGLVACVAVVWMSLNQNIDQYLRGTVTIAAIRPIPKVYISVWITYGFLSSALYFLRHMLWRPGAAAELPQGLRV